MIFFKGLPIILILSPINLIFLPTTTAAIFMSVFYLYFVSQFIFFLENHAQIRQIESPLSISNLRSSKIDHHSR
jgi:hypothetical protein